MLLTISKTDALKAGLTSCFQRGAALRRTTRSCSTSVVKADMARCVKERDHNLRAAGKRAREEIKCG